MLLVLLAGCSGTRKSGSGSTGRDSQGGPVSGTPPAFALPGIPMKEELEAAPAEETKTIEEIKAEAPISTPAEAKTAAAAPAAGKDLEFHLNAAAKYAARKQNRSAAAEYGAALGFLPAGDARAVYLLERQGAMMLRTRNLAKAQEYFLSAIGKAKELNTAGKDLAGSHLGLGYCLEKANKIPDALTNYEKALELSAGKTTKDRIAKTISDLKKAPK